MKDDVGALHHLAVGRAIDIIVGRAVAIEDVRGGEDAGAALPIAEPGGRSRAPHLAVVVREGDHRGELRLVGEGEMGAKATFGAPGAVEDDDGVGGTRCCGERARGEGACGEAASGRGHERTSRITMAASPVSRGGSASGQARR